MKIFSGQLKFQNLRFFLQFLARPATLAIQYSDGEILSYLKSYRRNAGYSNDVRLGDDFGKIGVNLPKLY